MLMSWVLLLLNLNIFDLSYSFLLIILFFAWWVFFCCFLFIFCFNLWWAFNADDKPLIISLWLNNKIVISLYLFVDRPIVYFIPFAWVFFAFFSSSSSSFRCFTNECRSYYASFSMNKYALSRNKDCTQNIQWERRKKKWKWKRKGTIRRKNSLLTFLTITSR